MKEKEIGLILATKYRGLYAVFTDINQIYSRRHYEWPLLVVYLPSHCVECSAAQLPSVCLTMDQQENTN